MKLIRILIFVFLISIPTEAQTSAGGGENPPAPKGNTFPGQGELPIDDYIPLFFVFGVIIGAYFLSKSKSVVK